MAIDSGQSLNAAAAFEFPGAGGAFLRRVTNRFGFQVRFTSIALRIFVLNLFALAILVGGILYLNQFREGLVKAKVDSLIAEGEIIAQAIAQIGTSDTSELPIKSGPLRDLQPSGFADPASGSLADLSFKINPEQIAPLLRHIVKPARARARIYDRNGNLLLDSQGFYSRGQIIRLDLPPVETQQLGFFERAWNWLRSRGKDLGLPLYHDIGAENGKAYDEVKIALSGTSMQIVRIDDKGNTIVSVGVPIQRLQAIQGALMLTTKSGDIDTIIAKERSAIIRTSGLVIVVTLVLSLFLAGTIAGPIHRLASAAERVRRNLKTRQEIPDFTHRSDEVGHLSRALREMTAAMYHRIEAIESFAADVAHELKNPLTSLRSAAETLAIARNDAERERLVGIILHDVRRLNRLISDISDASRLDAELARESAKPVNVASLLDTITNLTNEVHGDAMPEIDLDIKGVRSGAEAKAARDYMISGHDGRLGQVINNLLDNAASFSPPDGKIHISLRRLKRRRKIEMVIEDEGPGIRPENLDRIFERFYTDRPGHESFGQNSGLGLNISRQIVEAHGGRIWAENRCDAEMRSQVGAARVTDAPKGARFVIHLPAL